MNQAIRDFDQFLAEKEDRRMRVRIFGRDCEVPLELPYYYVLKIEAMVKEGRNIQGDENMTLLRQMFQPEDFAFITQHPQFKASTVWELIAYTWLNESQETAKEPQFKTEDDLKIAQTQGGSKKKG